MKELNKNIVIRKMRKCDIEEAMTILSRWNMAPVAPSPEKPDPERSSIDIDNAFVALQEGNVIGIASYIVLSDTIAETASLAVDPHYRGGGIGYKLQKARLEEMRRLGIRKVRTETDRIETINWYKAKFGYREIGRNPKKHDFSLTDIDEWTVLELDLDDYFATGEKLHGRE
jgi:3-keto-5-aminohexanoate cleavage enzyme